MRHFSPRALAHTALAPCLQATSQHPALVYLPSTGYIFYQSYVRRTQGKQEAREVFRSTKELRKKGTLTYHVRWSMNRGALTSACL